MDLVRREGPLTAGAARKLSRTNAQDPTSVMDLYDSKNIRVGVLDNMSMGWKHVDEANRKLIFVTLFDV